MIQPVIDWSYAYLEALSRSSADMKVVVGMGQANLDTEEVRGSSPPGPTILFLSVPET
jgi:hypothetical protein